MMQMVNYIIVFSCNNFTQIVPHFFANGALSSAHLNLFLAF